MIASISFVIKKFIEFRFENAQSPKFEFFPAGPTSLDNSIYRELQQHLRNDFLEPLVFFGIGGDESSHPAVARGVQ